MLFCSCSKQKTYTQEELYEKVSSGVLLIKTNFIQTITISDGSRSCDYRFVLNNNGIEFYENWENVDDSEIQNTSYGTGFLISPNGIVVTNSHVVIPKAENGDYIFQALKQYINKRIIHDLQNIDLYTRQKEAILSMDKYAMDKYGLSNEDSKTLRDINKFLYTTPKIIEENNEKLRWDKYEIKPNVTEINVAYNNSNIYNPKSWIYCTELVNNSSYDLAIIQMHQFTKNDVYEEISKYENSEDFNTRFFAKNYALSNLIGEEDFKRYKGWKIVPDDKYIFSISEITPNTAEIKLYMVGYNQGPILAHTESGIKAQITQGNISQNTDDVQIMYSIPALQGSSGSPVLNQYGELVAINFAGISTTQNFNYGIKVDKLKELIKDTRVSRFMDNNNNKHKEETDTVVEVAVSGI